jgi:hypothetical protein
MKRPVRVPKQVSESLHHRLNSYAIVASAAGVGLLALAQPAEARIIYTPANIKLRPNRSYYLDINHDGVRDFELDNVNVSPRSCTCYIQQVLVTKKQNGKGIWGTSHNPLSYASALSSGVQIGSNRKLTAGQKLMWGGSVNKSNHSSYRTYGLWKNAENRYLGLKFISVRGQQVHYGWARLSVTVAGKPPYATAVLTGYAYETIPNKPIIAGKTHGGNQATLGHLATGASAIPAWRVKPTAATSH